MTVRGNDWPRTQKIAGHHEHHTDGARPLPTLRGPTFQAFDPNRVT